MIYSEELAKLVRHKRHDAGISIEDAASDTGLSVEFIKGLESGELTSKYSDAYLVGKVRNYARYLGISSSEMKKITEADEKVDKRRTLRLHRKIHAPIVTSSLLMQALVVVIIGGLIGYLSYQVMTLAGNPQLSVDSPVDNQVIPGGEFEIIGTTSSGSEVTIDGQSVLVGDDGSFRLPLSLREGVYTLDIEASSTLGRTTRVERTVVIVAGED